MIKPLTFLLTTIISFIAVIIGLIISRYSFEELKQAKKVFQILRYVFFILASLLILTQNIILGLSVLIIGIILSLINFKNKRIIFSILVLILIFLSNSVNFFFTLSSILIIMALLDTGLWASNNLKLLKTKKVWKSLIIAHIHYLTLPILGFILKLII
jgi:hypothetical protein